MTNDKQAECNLCGGTGCLTQKGILKVYLLGLKLPIALIMTGIAGGIIYSNYMFILTVMGVLYPPVMADFRLSLYPVAAISHCLGKKLNCPKCVPHCSMFRRG